MFTLLPMSGKQSQEEIKCFETYPTPPEVSAAECWVRISSPRLATDRRRLFCSANSCSNSCSRKRTNGNHWYFVNVIYNHGSMSIKLPEKSYSKFLSLHIKFKNVKRCGLGKCANIFPKHSRFLGFDKEIPKKYWWWWWWGEWKIKILLGNGALQWYKMHFDFSKPILPCSS